MPYSGPNPDICFGPDADNYVGSSGAVGPDPTLPHGQNVANRCGVSAAQWSNSPAALSMSHQARSVTNVEKCLTHYFARRAFVH